MNVDHILLQRVELASNIKLCFNISREDPPEDSDELKKTFKEAGASSPPSLTLVSLS